MKTYSDLILLPTFEERFRYLKLDGIVGESTFGFDRYLNQKFYRTDPEWLRLRDLVIIRDNGCDLGIFDREIHGRVIIHHMNPITQEDIIKRTPRLLNPEFLITTVKSTHDAIHYGSESYLDRNKIIVRTKNDTCPWRK